MFKRFFARPSAVFALVYAWKIALLVFSAQPVPSNDSFFYDGPVVNFLLHGKYANPSLALALPISGTEVFCAYPPLYQALLLGWMSLFGTSVISAMVLHLLLFGLYLLVLLAVLRRLNLPVWAIHLAALFLLVMTFHDRPDSLAHVFGMAAIYAWIRSRAARGWLWAMAAFTVLGLCTGLQIGGLYFLLIGILILSAGLFMKEPFPFAPMAALLLIPGALVALVVLGFPHLWAGFLEHARQTPALTGWRLPGVAEILKMGRTVPGILAVAVLLPWLFGRLALNTPHSTLMLITLTSTLAALAMIAGSMFVLTANAVGFAAYLQPLVVGGYLVLAAPLIAKPKLLRVQQGVFIALATLGSIRAIGMTTWGLACSADVGYRGALQHVRQELETGTAERSVVLSAAYLYEAARHQEFRWIHCDWLGKAGTGEDDLKAMISVKPVKLILTQFDYYRRYEPVLEQLKARPGLVEFQVINTAKVPAPDSIRPLRKVVQHVSWAPVIVALEWKAETEEWIDGLVD